MRRFTFKAFWAVDEPGLCSQYAEGHVQVLRDYGITNITSNNQLWTKLNCVAVIVVYDEEGEMVGGIRVQKADGENMLPVEKAISFLDPKIHEIIGSYIHEGVGELCALWNSKKVAGYGLSLLLSRAGIALSTQMGISIMVGICADYTLKMFKKVGFQVDDSLGHQGEFVYPNENYIARVLGILNAKNLETAEEEDRMRMLDVRLNPLQLAVENGPKGEMEIKYEMLLQLK